MNTFETLGMRYDGANFFILDQSRLPWQEEWVRCDDCDCLLKLIERLAIRGAPALGIAAAVILGLQAERGAPAGVLHKLGQRLISARPTAVNIRTYVETLLRRTKSQDFVAALVAEVEEIIEQDKELCERIARLGAELIQPRDQILTHCHTGGLATAGSGTAFGVIRRAHEQNKQINLWVNETRPLLQGARLTAWECRKYRIPHTVICDSAAGLLMQQGLIDRVFVGSDRIARNGDFANKIGTYSLAVLAAQHNIPFYVVAPCTTIDPYCPHGGAIVIEYRPPSEIFSTVAWGAAGDGLGMESQASNPAFDITPASLVTGWVLDTGIFFRNSLSSGHWWLAAG